jgi:hypothetical protein
MDYLDEKSTYRPLHDKEICFSFKIKPSVLEQYMKSAKIMGDEAPEQDPNILLMLNLRLYTIMNNNLNYLTNHGTVKEFKHIFDVIANWYPAREHYYKLQTHAEIYINTCMLIKLREEIRYIEQFDTMKIAGIEDEKKAYDKLEQFKFIKLNNSTLTEAKQKISIKKFINNVIGFETIDAVEEANKVGKLYDAQVVALKETALEPNKINYDYLLNMNDKSKFKTTIISRNEKIKEIESRLQYLKTPSAWKDIWLSELTSLEDLLKEHLPRMWEKLFDISV